MNVPEFTLWDGPEYGTGTTIQHVMTGILDRGVSIDSDVKGEGGADLAALVTEPWVSSAVPGTTVRHQHPGSGIVKEYWVGDRLDGFRQQGGVDVVEFHLYPFHHVLAMAGPIEGTVSPAIGQTNLGLRSGSMRNFLATFAIPWLTAKGFDYISIGTMDSDKDIGLFRWDLWTVQQVVIELARRGGFLEWQLARNDVDSDYQIDIVSAIGSSNATAWAAEGLNITSLSRRKESTGMWTVMRPTGLLASGDEQRADISQNSWPVSSVSSDNVTVGAHNGGDGPIGEDDQWVGNYLEAADGTLWEIMDSTQSTQVFGMDTGEGSNFAAGDDVSIVRNSAGDPLTEVSSPSGVTSFGRHAGSLDLSELGHRNWIRNPFFADWTATPAGHSCLKDTTQSGTSYNLKGLPVGLVIAAGDLLMVPFTVATPFTRITTGDTVDGSGLATVVVAATMGSITDGRYMMVVVQGADPDHFDRSQAGSNALVLLKTPRSAARTISCAVDGAQTFGQSDEHELNLKDLGASTVVPEGTLISQSVTSRGWITKGGTADGTGDLTVSFAYELPWNPADAAALTLHTPDLSGFSGTDAPGWMKGFGTAIHLDHDFSVRYRADRDVLYVTAHCRAMGSGGWASGDTTKTPPSLQLMTTPSTVVDTDEAADWTPAAVPEELAFTLQVTTTMTVTDEFRARIVWPNQSTGNEAIGAAPWMWVEAIEVHLGPQKTVPVIEGSGASTMIQQANTVRADVNDWTTSYEASLIELAEVSNVSPVAVRVSEGAQLRLRNDRLSIDEEVRIMGFRYDSSVREDLTVVLKKRLHRLTRDTARAKKSTLYTRVDVVVNEGAADEETVGQTAIPTEEPPEAVGVVVGVAKVADFTSDVALPLAKVSAE